MMNREEQIKFMEQCQERVQGYVASWLRDPLFRQAVYRRCIEPDKPRPSDDCEDKPLARKFG